MRDPSTLPTTKRRLRILYHHRTRARDGQSVHIDELITALRADGHDIAIVEPRRRSPLAQNTTGKVLPRGLYETLEFAYSAVEFCKLAAKVLSFRPDALYERANILMLSGTWIARLFRLPFLLEINSPLTRERARFGGLALRAFAEWTEHVIWRAADRVLPVTQVLANEIAATGVPAHRIVVIPNGVDLTRFSPTDRAARKRQMGLEGVLVLGFAGFIREWHGLEQIIDLLAAEPGLATAHLLLIGDGPARPALEARATEVGVADRITFTGLVARDDMPTYLGAVDIALQPEATPYASPLKLFEYMALGLAIAAPDMPNIREVVTDAVDALLFTPGDFASLSDIIRRLALDGALRTKLGLNAARKIVDQDVTWEHNARVVSALIEELAPVKT